MPFQLRDLIAGTATELGPQAPTLCSPWTVADLLAHLVVRESRPDALPGIGLPVPLLQRRTRTLQDRVAARPFPELVEQVRSGPAPWWPTRIGVLDRAMNVAELSIHHEDMVRAQPDWAPTDLPGPVQDGLWRTVTSMGRMLTRGAPTGVVVVAQGHGRAALRRPPATAGTVVLHGTPLELVLHLFGRTEVARVDVQGSAEDLQAFATHRTSL